MANNPIIPVVEKRQGCGPDVSEKVFLEKNRKLKNRPNIF